MDANSMEAPVTSDHKDTDRQKKTSFAGIAGAGVAFLLVSLGVLFFLSSTDAGAHSVTLVDQQYGEVDLEVIHREIPGHPGGAVSNTFLCQPVLVLNPDMDDFEEILAHLEKRKNSIRGELFRILYDFPVHYFRSRDVLSRVSDLFRKAVNSLLGPNFEGKEIVTQVTFPVFEAPIS